MGNRKFRTGDTVLVTVTSPSKRHFETGFIGLLGRTYGQQYGGGGEDFTVIHPTRGPISWYSVSEFTLIAPATAKSELQVRRMEDRG